MKGQTTQERFWNKVIKTETCWVWVGSTYPDGGYGCFWDGKKNARAHRWVMEHLKGVKIPPKYLVCHKCDNPPCVNPDHLFVGTYSEWETQWLLVYS